MDYNTELQRFFQAAWDDYRSKNPNVTQSQWYAQNGANLKSYFDTLYSQRTAAPAPAAPTSPAYPAPAPAPAPSANEVNQLNQALDNIMAAYGVDRATAASILMGTTPRPGDGATTPQGPTGLPLGELKPGIDWERLAEDTRAAKVAEAEAIRAAQAREQQARDELAFAKGNAVGQVDGTNTLDSVKYANDILSNPRNAALNEMIRKGYALGNVPGGTVVDYLGRSLGDEPAFTPNTTPPVTTPAPTTQAPPAPATQAPVSTPTPAQNPATVPYVSTPVPTGTNLPFSPTNPPPIGSRTGGTTDSKYEQYTPEQANPALTQIREEAIATGVDPLGYPVTQADVDRTRAVETAVAQPNLTPEERAFQASGLPDTEAGRNEYLTKINQTTPEGTNRYDTATTVYGQTYYQNPGETAESFQTRMATMQQQEQREQEQAKGIYTTSDGSKFNSSGLSSLGKLPDFSKINLTTPTATTTPTTTAPTTSPTNFQFKGLSGPIAGGALSGLKSLSGLKFKDGGTLKISGYGKGTDKLNLGGLAPAQENPMSGMASLAKARDQYVSNGGNEDSFWHTIQYIGRLNDQLSTLASGDSARAGDTRWFAQQLGLDSAVGGAEWNPKIRNVLSTLRRGRLGEPISKDASLLALTGLLKDVRPWENPASKNFWSGLVIPETDQYADGGQKTLKGQPHWIVDNSGNPVAALTEDGKKETVRGQGGVEVIPMTEPRRSQYMARKNENRNAPGFANLGASAVSNRMAPSRRPGGATGNANRTLSRQRANLPGGIVADTRTGARDGRANNGKMNNGRNMNTGVRQMVADKDAASILPRRAGNNPQAARIGALAEDLAMRMQNRVPPQVQVMANGTPVQPQAGVFQPVGAATGATIPTSNIAPRTVDTSPTMLPSDTTRTGSLSTITGTQDKSAASGIPTIPQTTAPTGIASRTIAPSLTMVPTANAPSGESITRMPVQTPVPMPTAPVRTTSVATANSPQTVGGISGNFGATTGDANYSPSQDLNHDGRITSIDLSLASRRGVERAPGLTTNAPGMPPLFIANGDSNRVLSNRVAAPRFGFMRNSPFAGQNQIMRINSNMPGVQVGWKWAPRTLRDMTTEDRQLLESYISAQGQDPATFWELAQNAEPGSAYVNRSFR